MQKLSRILLNSNWHCGAPLFSFQSHIGRSEPLDAKFGTLRRTPGENGSLVLRAKMIQWQRMAALHALLLPMPRSQYGYSLCLDCYSPRPPLGITPMVGGQGWACESCPPATWCDFEASILDSFTGTHICSEREPEQNASVAGVRPCDRICKLKDCSE